LKRVALWVVLAHGLVIAALLQEVQHEVDTPPRPLPIQLQLQSSAVQASAAKLAAPRPRAVDPVMPQPQRDLSVQQPKDMPPSTIPAPTASVTSSPSGALSTPSSSVGSAADPVRSSAAEERQPMIDASFRGNRIPDYPQMSRRLGEQGAVVLRVMISPDGRAGEIQLSKSSGYARLDRAAIEAVREWRFVPALKGGRPVAAWYEWRWEFRLEN
jgi:protein TonB